jgi:hypothetical protein
MSNHTTFPDAIVFPDGTIRLVTDAAKQWAYTNTNIDRWCELSTVPDYVDFNDSIPPLMEGKGLVVQWKQMPVSHYRSKRRKWPKSTSDGNVIKFLEKIPESCRQDAMFRAYGRHKARNWRLMQERDEKRQEELQDELTET